MKLRKRNIERAAIRTRRWARARQRACELFSIIEPILSEVIPAAYNDEYFEGFIQFDEIIRELTTRPYDKRRL